MTDTTNRRQRKTFTGMPVLLAAVLVICLVGYWAQLWMGYDAMRNDVRASTTRLASQSARVLALQVNTLFRKLDYFSQQLSTVWLEGDERLFDRSVLTAMHSLPPNALVQVAVTDARGEVVYSRLEDALVELDPRNPISVADRAHFQAHVMASESFFYVSSPVLGRISKQWTIQFTRGLWEGDTFKGVLVMVVSADHLSAALKATFPDEQDVAVVVREDGAYLARSRKQDEVLGSFVIKERPFLQDTALKSGSYQATAVVDGIKRQYAWWRGDDYPFVVSVGYGEEQALATAEQAITESILQNIISSILLVVGLLVVSRLWFIRSKQAAQLQQVQQRLELAIKGGHLAAWDWDLRNDRLEVNQTWTELFGYDPTRQICTSAEWMSRIHPDDLGRVQAECSAALESDGRIFDLEYRIVLEDGTSAGLQIVDRWFNAIRMVRLCAWQASSKTLPSAKKCRWLSPSLANC